MNKKFLGLAFLSLLLIGTAISALAVLWDNANKPGLPAHAQKNWPFKTSLKRHSTFPTLVMFALPHCDCTEATLSELNEIMAKVNNRLSIIIVFATPEPTGLLSLAQLIPDAQIISTQGALEADIFGARTSGQVLLYDPQGQLVFSGGITRARGHAGNNAGKSAIISFINNHRLTTKSAPVFGCALKESSNMGYTK